MDRILILQKVKESTTESLTGFILYWIPMAYVFWVLVEGFINLKTKLPMNRISTQNKVSVCKKDVCVHVAGELAQAFAAALIFAALAYGVAQIAKAIK